MAAQTPIKSQTQPIRRRNIFGEIQKRQSPDKTFRNPNTNPILLAEKMEKSLKRGRKQTGVGGGKKKKTYRGVR